MAYQWSIPDTSTISEDFLRACSDDSLVARLLLNRGIRETQLTKFFLDVNSVIPTPALAIPDMDQAILRIMRAIRNQERILIYGDYDVDGTSSVALLYRAFGIIGVQVEYYIPSRHSEGYGINKQAVLHIRQELKIDLMISCDCGISNYAEVEYANSLGLDVIITDHHSIPKQSPPSIANCNPKTLAPNHPLHYLPGVGVAYKLAELILEHNLEASLAKSYAYSLLDLVALGMVADLAPLLAENRYLTIQGLKVLTQTKKPGLIKLLEVSGIRYDPEAEHIGFGLAPRINAAGRLADATRAVRLMITEDFEEARELAEELDIANQERQELCKSTFDEALEMIADDSSMINDNCIVLASETWHHGVIGIVASRILERFNLPVFIMSIENDKIRGSVRCINIPNLDIFEEMNYIQDKHSLFSKFGGHKMAAGFSVESSKLDALKQALRLHFRLRLANENISKHISIDAALRLSELNSSFFDRISKLSPYGIENPSPVFVSTSLQIQSLRNIGKDGKHLKLQLKEINNPKIYEAVLWNRAEEFLEEYHQELINQSLAIVYNPKINEYGNERLLQLDIKDWQLSSKVNPAIFARFQRNLQKTQ